MTLEFDCQSCGACCAAGRHDGPQDYYVRLTPEDFDRLGARGKRLTVVYDNRCGETLRAMRFNKKGGRRTCIALEGEIGVRVSCAIYSDRPRVCKNFEPGDQLCLIAREEAGLSDWKPPKKQRPKKRKEGKTKLPQRWLWDPQNAGKNIHDDTLIKALVHVSYGAPAGAMEPGNQTITTTYPELEKLAQEDWVLGIKPIRDDNG